MPEALQAVLPFISMTWCCLLIGHQVTATPTNRNISNTHEESYRACGANLHLLRASFCSVYKQSPHGKRSLDTIDDNDRSDYANGEDEHDLWDQLRQSGTLVLTARYIRLRRYSKDIGIVDECCFKSCTKRTILTYC